MAVLAFGLTFLIGGVVGGGSKGSGTQVGVLIAANDIAFRTELADSDLTVQKFASTDVPPGAYLENQRKEVVHLTAEVGISKGQPILANMLAKSSDSITGLTTSYLPLPTGWVALTIPTNEQQGVAGYPQPGDYITIIANVNVQLFNPNTGQNVGPQQSVVKTVFQYLHIIRVGPATGSAQPATGGGAGAPSGSQGGVSSSLTVEVTQCDAEYIDWLLQNASLKYSLVSYKDYKPAPTAADPSCPKPDSTHGVNAQAANDRWHFV